MNRRNVTSPTYGAGQGQCSPAKASNLSSDEDRDSRRRRNEPMQKRRRKFVVVDEDDEEEENEVQEDCGRAESSNAGNGESEEEEPEEATPIGKVVRVSGLGEQKVKHYRAFEYARSRYVLEDPVLLSPEDESLKPYVAIIKDITENISNGMMMLTCQCFYRPEDARKEGGGTCQACDSRELYYTFHIEEFGAESVMHKCVVNYVPLHKQLPNRRQFPGFIVQRVYDTENRELYELTDEKFEDTRRLEIDRLLNETKKRIGDLSELDMDVEREHRSTNLSPGSKSKKDEEESKFQIILANFHALTKESRRDYWLRKLLQSVEYVCNSSGSSQSSAKKDENRVIWPDSAVSAVTAVERTSNKEYSTYISKYNAKMRSLDFNLKKNALLALRLLKGELTPSVILNMSPNELKVRSTRILLFL
ncbi:hypothetical protein V2J09_004920 [Rumex salicifolius]